MDPDQTGWSGSMLVANALRWFCHDAAHIEIVLFCCPMIINISEERNLASLTQEAIDHAKTLFIMSLNFNLYFEICFIKNKKQK
jgi:hypothetical protein